MADNYDFVPNGNAGKLIRRSVETPANSGIYADGVVIVGADGTPGAGAATEAKQDTIITKLNTIITDQLNVATTAKQDTQTTALGTLATSAKQDTEIAAIGAPADVAWSGSGNSTLIAALKAIWTKLGAVVLAAGSAVIGNVGIDQTTPGTTNGVVASPVAITTATHSNVAAANADTALLASNASRKPGSTIVNDSTAILYIKLGSGASATSYMVAMDGKTTVGGIFPVPDGYTGAVNGFWASATGSARVTEMT